MKNLMKTNSLNVFIFCFVAFCILLSSEVYANASIEAKGTPLIKTDPMNLEMLRQTLKYGDKYFIKNHYGKGSYLETCGHSKCTSGSKYNVSTHIEPNRGGHKSGTWIISSASGKKTGTNVLIGDVVYLKNVYGGGTYLETCGHSKCTSGSKYNVSTHIEPNRGGHKSGTWEIVSTTGEAKGNKVKLDVAVYLKNIYGGGTYLETCGHSDCTSGSSFKVSTHIKANRGGVNTGKWSFEVANYSTKNINTVYSADGIPVMQFKYNESDQTYNTECSVPDWVSDVDFTTTTDKYLDIFAPACHQHDLNYRAPWRMAGFSNYSGKVVADEKFYADMKKICDDTHDNIIEENYCKIVAGVWYEAVKNHGHDSFDDGQVEASKDCNEYSIDKGGYISVYSDAGYVTEVKVNYIEKGKRVYKSGKITALQTKEFPIPIGASDINLNVEGIACGLSFSKNYPKAVSKEFKVWGTIFDTEWKEL